MTRPRAPKAPTPVTAVALKTRPMGKLPKGVQWDPVGGCLVSVEGGRFKRKATVEACADENLAPQQPMRVRRA